MQIELSSEELRYIRAALMLVIAEREELIETGRLAKELAEDPLLEAGRESMEYEEKLTTLLTKLPTA